MQENKVKITEIKEYYTVTRKEKNKEGELISVEKNTWKYKEVNFVTGWARFGHYILDRVFYYIVLTIFAFTFGAILALLGAEELLQTINETLLEIIFYIIVYPAYYLLLEATSQASLAKLILGRVVVDEYGNKPTFNQILKRSYSRIVPFEPLSCFGNTGWHDDWSKTYVIRKKDLEDLKVLARLQEHLESSPMPEAV